MLEHWLRRRNLGRQKTIVTEKNCEGRGRDNFKNINEAVDKVSKREASEKKRYREFYNIDLDDMKIYDLILNTEKFDIPGMTEIVSLAVEKLIIN